MAKQKAKKRHIANSDTDSENSYPASQPTNSSSSTSTKKPYVPRFLIIHSKKEDESISSLSPFLVHKTIMSLTGEPKSIKNLRSGDLLIQCAKEKHETTLLNLKNFCGLKCKVTPHSSLNISKGIVRCPALNRQTCEHILEFMGEQGVTDVRRISVFRDGSKKPTNTFVFTFNSPVLPFKIGFMQVKVDVYIPNPLRCYQEEVVLARLRLGHTRVTHSYLLLGEEQPHCVGCDAPFTVRHFLLDCGDFAQVMTHQG